MAEKPNNVFARVGQLATLGVEDRWQTAIYLPESIDDIRTQHSSAPDLSVDTFEPIVLRLTSAPTVTSRPFMMVKATVEDRDRNQFQAQFSGALQAALAPVPSAISAIYHVVIGSLLAAVWRRRGEGE